MTLTPQDSRYVRIQQSAVTWRASSAATISVFVWRQRRLNVPSIPNGPDTPAPKRSSAETPGSLFNCGTASTIERGRREGAPDVTHYRWWRVSSAPEG